MARVTVFVPTYNRARFLPHALDSIFAQTYDDFVVVVADNASTDETPEVVARYDDPRLTYVRRPENIGITATHNRCLESLETEYSLILPDDDVLYPEALEVGVATLDAHPRAGMVHGTFDVIGPGGETLLEHGNWTFSLEHDIVEPGPDFLRESMTWGARVCASTALMRTAALPEVRFDPGDFPAIDLGLWLRMALRWDMAFVARRLCAYRIHDASHSAAFGPPMGPGYIMGPDMVNRLLAVKRRFIDGLGGELDEAERAELARLAEQARRTGLLVLARNLTVPERRFGPTVRAVRAVLGEEPRLAADRRVWQLVAASAVGRRTVDRVKRTLGRPVD
jgi:glycosyltransferase involved in cell wall biosynthesis